MHEAWKKEGNLFSSKVYNLFDHLNSPKGYPDFWIRNNELVLETYRKTSLTAYTHDYNVRLNKYVLSDEYQEKAKKDAEERQAEIAAAKVIEDAKAKVKQEALEILNR